MAGSVGFVGLGNMGGPMALNQPCRVDIVHHQLKPGLHEEPLVAAGATVETSPEAVAARCHRTLARNFAREGDDRYFVQGPGIGDRLRQGAWCTTADGESEPAGLPDGPGRRAQ
jgi:hypothetical protein